MCAVWHVTYCYINEAKTVCMVVHPKGCKWKSDYPTVTLETNILKFVTSVKYLGHVIRNDLSEILVYSCQVCY